MKISEDVMYTAPELHPTRNGKKVFMSKKSNYVIHNVHIARLVIATPCAERAKGNTKPYAKFTPLQIFFQPD